MSDCRFTQCGPNIHQSGYSVVQLVHGWCHVKLLRSRRTFCVHHTNMHQFTVSLFKATYVGCMRVQMQPTTCTFDRDLLRAIEKHGRGMGIHHGEQELFTMSKIYHMYPNQQYPSFFFFFRYNKDYVQPRKLFKCTINFKQCCTKQSTQLKIKIKSWNLATQKESWVLYLRSWNLASGSSTCTRYLLFRTPESNDQ